MDTVAELTLNALVGAGVAGIEQYSGSLIAACDAHRPPFGMAWYGDQYRSYARDPYWLASSLVANAEVEGDGARKLWKIAGYAGEQAEEKLIQQHAVDEARHAKLYIYMLETVFPGVLDEDLKTATREMSPPISMRESVERSEPVQRLRLLDDLVQMNIGEIRTRIHQQLLRPVILAHSPLEQRDRITRSLDSLLRDETKHIAYTAELIEAQARAGYDDFIRVTMAKRLAQFNEITLNEVGALIFDGE
jgi:hypothetical protein